MVIAEALDDTPDTTLYCEIANPRVVSSMALTLLLARNNPIVGLAIAVAPSIAG